MEGGITINKYLPIAIIYFFFNAFMLPNGLLYTTILTPLLLLWIRFSTLKRSLGIYFMIMVPFAIAHYLNGVYIKYYLISSTLLLSVYIFSIAFYQFLVVCKTLRTIYKVLLVANFYLCLLAIIALLAIPSLREILWSQTVLSYKIEDVNRLQLFTYEPSYYATLLTPLALYYYLKAFLKKLPDPVTTILYITLPLILSLSMGVISALVISLSITMLVNISAFFSRPKLALYIITGGMALTIFLLVGFLAFPESIVFKRLINIFEGHDTSFHGRTNDAFFLGWNVAKMKSLFWGAGLGQTKVLGPDLWFKLYKFTFTQNEIAIPNAVADTLAVFGIAGVCIRLSLQIYFYFKTKVSSNHYRLALFIFAFIYQFTGSFIYNIAEYVIWIMAFSNIFPEFNKKTPIERNQ